jgi:hypothetical protein
MAMRWRPVVQKPKQGRPHHRGEGKHHRPLFASKQLKMLKEFKQHRTWSKLALIPAIVGYRGANSALLMFQTNKKAVPGRGQR